MKETNKQIKPTKRDTLGEEGQKIRRKKERKKETNKQTDKQTNKHSGDTPGSLKMH